MDGFQTTTDLETTVSCPSVLMNNNKENAWANSGNVPSQKKARHINSGLISFPLPKPAHFFHFSQAFSCLPQNLKVKASYYFQVQLSV